jgi:hypothetical protein
VNLKILFKLENQKPSFLGLQKAKPYSNTLDINFFDRILNIINLYDSRNGGIYEVFECSTEFKIEFKPLQERTMKYTMKCPIKLSKKFSMNFSKIAVMALTLTSAAMLTSCRTSTKSETKDIDGSPSTGELSGSTSLAGHGMVVFGEQTIYLYHLPMWHGVHAWQIILEASMDTQSLALYQADRVAGSHLNTFSPKSFALAQIKPGFKIAGTLFHGHFEQGGTPLAQGIESVLTVQRVVMIKALNPNETKRTTPMYRVFGHGTKWFAAHVASHNPDFDQVLDINPVPNLLSEANLNAGVNVQIPGGSNDAASRPVSGAQLSGQMTGGIEMPVSVLDETYFSESDLGQ